jgi:hypothetical protein
MNYYGRRARCTTGPLSISAGAKAGIQAEAAEIDQALAWAREQGYIGQHQIVSPSERATVLSLFRNRS